MAPTLSTIKFPAEASSSAVIEVLPSPRIALSLQKPATISSIELTSKEEHDNATKRKVVKEECAAALRILAKYGFDHFAVRVPLMLPV